ncbi:MAG: hypothetical protein JXB32_12165 [Deltaproteobacteria bacterium]|nr:hypothetical protein [Deltaproteobacteria bacterium]
MTVRTWIVIGLLAGLAAFAACGDDSSDDTDVTDARDIPDVADEGTTCTPPTVLCGTECVNTQSSSAHCGECDNACATTEVCRAGVCELNCPDGPYADCGETDCTGLLSDPAHCGECGYACDSGETCSCGVCVGECHDFNTDHDNCGTCGNACDSGEECCCGECMAPAACPDPCPMIDIPDQLDCGGGCVDSLNDMLHCGACDAPCSLTEACGDAVCTSEVCYGVNEVYCDGHCTNLRSNSQNCGRCGNACNPETEYCFEGTCRVAG